MAKALKKGNKQDGMVLDTPIKLNSMKFYEGKT